MALRWPCHRPESDSLVRIVTSSCKFCCRSVARLLMSLTTRVVTTNDAGRQRITTAPEL